MLSANVERAHLKLQEALSPGGVTASLDSVEGGVGTAPLPSSVQSPRRGGGLNGGTEAVTPAAAGIHKLLDGVQEHGDDDGGSGGGEEEGAAWAFHSALEEAAVLLPDGDQMDDALAACRLHRCVRL